MIIQVASSLTDEIRRLAALVDEFERPFHPDPLVLNTYKKVSAFYVTCHLFQSRFIGQLLQ